ncbi:hypothetical protein ACFYM0_11030 [Streptomyces sp. NPDC006487]|uniref:hypothetical protein n=1 Tax=Streptomyces sp. NPDC006487 TaxID=3364748 RepID=UPI003678FF67
MCEGGAWFAGPRTLRIDRADRVVEVGAGQTAVAAGSLPGVPGPVAGAGSSATAVAEEGRLLGRKAPTVGGRPGALRRGDRLNLQGHRGRGPGEGRMGSPRRRRLDTAPLAGTARH